jgi:hypothetical protein
VDAGVGGGPEVGLVVEGVAAHAAGGGAAEPAHEEAHQLVHVDAVVVRIGAAREGRALRRHDRMPASGWCRLSLGDGAVTVAETYPAICSVTSGYAPASRACVTKAAATAPARRSGSRPGPPTSKEGVAAVLPVATGVREAVLPVVAGQAVSAESVGREPHARPLDLVRPVDVGADGSTVRAWIDDDVGGEGARGEEERDGGEREREAKLHGPPA